jgi:hypothetical protein
MNLADPIRVHVVIPRLAMLGLSVVIASRTAWAQTESTTSQQPVPAMVGVNNSATPADSYTPDTSGDRMTTPPPVSGQTYPIASTSEERANYLRGGLSFASAYTDNAVGGVNGHPISDISYSVAPMIALDETTSRLHFLSTYSPGFTFYQRNPGLNEADQNVSIELEYRLSPHVTLSARDGFQKSSNVFNQPLDLSGGAVSGGAEGANFSVIAPIADRLSNSGNIGISYQFGLNDMVGANGTFSNLHYPNPTQVPGLYDSSSQGGLVFYSRRVGKKQYIGATYAYQRLLSYPTVGVNETQTLAVLLFYTFSPSSSRFSFSFFGGPQYSDTVEPPLPAQQLLSADVRSWNPAGGASLGWQGRLNSFAVSYTHIISSGGGLIGAVKLDNAMASARQLITKTLSVSVTGGYAQNNLIGSPLLGLSNGHTISGTAALQQQVGQHLGVQLGYTRLRQDYSDIAVISATPNTNREFVSVSYQFSRPLGR